MALKNLEQFLKLLEKENELIIIDTQVSSYLEITEISNRVMKSKEFNKALLFTNIEGSEFPLCINIFGSEKRLKLALDDNLEDIKSDIHSFMQLSKYKGIKQQIKAIPDLARLYFSFPIKNNFGTAPSQQVVREPNLKDYPILHCWPDDGGPFFTMPLCFTIDPETNSQNVGMYRMQVFDETSTGMHWQLHKDGKKIYEKYRKLGIKKMPVSVVVGADPATIYASTAPLPPMIDEMMFASFLRKSPVSLTKCITNDIYVPRHAEFIFEGYVEVDGELNMEGPFGDHTGYYSLPEEYPVFHLTKVTHKKNPIFNATIVGMPPMEDCYLGLITEVIFLPLTQITLPEITNMHLPFEGVFHNLCLTTISKDFPSHAQKMMYNFWGLGQMMYQKMICVFDDGVDLKDYTNRFNDILLNVDIKEDIIMTTGPLDALDHSSKKMYQGTRVGIDVTSRILNESKRYENYILSREEIKIIKSTLESEKLIKDYRLLFVNNILLGIDIQLEKTSVNDISIVKKIQETALKNVKWIFVYDQYTDIQKDNYKFWRLFNNIDGKRDFYFNDNSLIIDATRKFPIENGGREWPDDIIMDPKIVNMVDQKWSQYGIN